MQETRGQAPGPLRPLWSYRFRVRAWVVEEKDCAMSRLRGSAPGLQPETGSAVPDCHHGQTSVATKAQQHAMNCFSEAVEFSAGTGTGEDFLNKIPSCVRNHIKSQHLG